MLRYGLGLDPETNEYLIMDNKKHIIFARGSDEKLLTEFIDYENEHLDKVETLEERVKDLEGQLPEGMQNCTILFKECDLGHLWLTATNWIQHGCQQCKIEKLEGKLKTQTFDGNVNGSAHGHSLHPPNNQEKK